MKSGTVDLAPLAALLLAAPLALAAPVVAQQRRTTLGIVRGADGAPQAGLDVTLAGALPPPQDPFAAPDLLTARTDADGRFRVELVPGLGYSAWATGAAATGQRLATAVHDGIRAGDVVELPARLIPAPESIEVFDFDAYPQLPARSVRLLLPAAYPPIDAALDAAGNAPLPPLPDAPVEVVVLDAAGQPLFASTQRPQATMRIWTLEPYPVPLRVVDAAGAPLAGVPVRQRLPSVHIGTPFERELWRELGPTDAVGQLVAHAVGADPFENGGGWGTLFAVAADGMAESYSGWYGHYFWRDCEPAAAPESGPVELVLRESPAFTGRLLDGGAPVGGRRVVVQVDCPLRPTPNGTVGLGRQFVTTTDRDGAFGLPSVPRSTASLQLGVAAPAAQPADAPVLGIRPGDDREVEIDLARLPRLRIQALRPDGSPATDAWALLLVARTAAPPATPRRLDADRAGRLQVSVEPGRWLLVVANRESAAARLVEVDAARLEPVLEVRMTGLATARGTIKTAADAPVPDCRLWVTGCQGDRSKPGNALQVLLRHYGLFLNQRVASGARTDAAGSFTLHFLDVPGMEFVGTTSRGETFRLSDGAELDLRVDGK